MNYCRYCSYCCYGDIYWCNKHDKSVNPKRATNCKDFHLSPLGCVETGRQYQPRPRIKEQDQIKIGE